MTHNPFYRHPPKGEPPLDCTTPFSLSSRVGEWGANARDDVGKIEVLLTLAGAHDLGPTDGPTGYFGSRLRSAIQKYQKDRGLTVDGEINPDGETLRTLARDLQNMGRNGDTVLAHLTPEEAQFLHTLTDGGSINPMTGLLEFWSDNDSENASEFGGANAGEQANDQAAENDAQGAAFGGDGDGMASVRAVNRARAQARAAARAHEARQREARRAEQARQAREREQRARMRDLERQREKERQDEDRRARARAFEAAEQKKGAQAGLLGQLEDDNDAQWGSGLWDASDNQAAENALDNDAQPGSGLWGATDNQAVENEAQYNAFNSQRDGDPAGYADLAPVNAVNNPETHREDFMDSLAERLGINLSKKAKQDPRTLDALLGAISYHKQTAKEQFQTLSKIASLAQSFPEFGIEGLKGDIALSISDPAKEPWSMTTEELYDLKTRNQQTIQALEALEKVDDFLNEEIGVKTHWGTFMDITGLKEAFEISNQRIDDELMNR